MTFIRSRKTITTMWHPVTPSVYNISGTHTIPNIILKSAAGVIDMPSAFAIRLAAQTEIIRYMGRRWDTTLKDYLAPNRMVIVPKVKFTGDTQDYVKMRMFVADGDRWKGWGNLFVAGVAA